MTTSLNNKRVGRLTRAMNQPQMDVSTLMNELTFYVPKLDASYATLFPRAYESCQDAIAAMDLVVRALHARHQMHGMPLRAQTILDYLKNPNRIVSLYNERVDDGVNEDKSMQRLAPLMSPEAYDQLAAHHRAWMLVLRPAIEMLDAVSDKQRVRPQQDRPSRHTSARVLAPSI